MEYQGNNNSNSNGNRGSKEKTATQQLIKQNVDSLIEQLEAGHSEALTAYLNAMGRFHNYSFGNILEIARQKPDATRVAGMYAWNSLAVESRRARKASAFLLPSSVSSASRRKRLKKTSPDRMLLSWWVHARSTTGEAHHVYSKHRSYRIPQTTAQNCEENDRCIIPSRQLRRSLSHRLRFSWQPVDSRPLACCRSAPGPVSNPTGL